MTSYINSEIYLPLMVSKTKSIKISKHGKTFKLGTSLVLSQIRRYTIVVFRVEAWC